MSSLAKSPVLRVVNCQSIDAIEALYTSLAHREGDLSLSIPTTTRDAHLGAIGSFIQFIITWAKHNPSGSLIMHDKHAGRLTVQITNLARTHHGLVALSTCNSVLSSDRKTNLSLDAEQEVITLLATMSADPHGYVTGPELLLLAADGTTYHRLPQLYHEEPSPQGTVRSSADFVERAGMWFDRLATIYRSVPELSEATKEHLGTILYELFKNTDLWARTDMNNCPVPHSVRGIRLELTTPRNIDSKSLADQHQHYLSGLERSLSQYNLLEIAVFDSGPGLAARGLGRSLDAQVTLNQEYEAIIRCLTLHRSTTEKSHRGVGLVEVMRSLTDAHGFLRVRTGRLALYRDFNKYPLVTDDDIALLDWKRPLGEISDLGHADGVLLSMLIPLRIKGRAK